MQHMFLFTMGDLIDEQLDIGRLDDPRRRCFEVIQENIGDNVAVIQKVPVLSPCPLRGYLTRGI